MNCKEENIRDLQLAELTILKEVKRICEKHEITYFLSGGTLLGAVRHGGFIPWDDDIDINMPWKDYEKFLDVCKDELGKNFFLQTYLTDENDHQSFAKIRMNDTTLMPMNHKRLQIHHGVWLDIFPLIGVCGERSFRFKKLILKVVNFIQMEQFIWDNEQEFINIMGHLWFKILRGFYHIPLKLRKKVHDRVFKYLLHSWKNGKYITELWIGLTALFKREVFEGKAVMLKFEDDFFPVPSGYIEYLTVQYGDYMKLPPVEQRVGHGDLIIDLHNDYSMYLEKM